MRIANRIEYATFHETVFETSGIKRSSSELREKQEKERERPSIQNHHGFDSSSSQGFEVDSKKELER